MQKLREIHEKVKNHPFRLNNSDWKGYYLLLEELDDEFTKELENHFKDTNIHGWDYFIHELRHGIWHFKFEFSDELEDYNLRGRLALKIKETATEEEKREYKERRYGELVPEFQKQIKIVIENYIQQIHKFIISGEFNEFLTFYTGGSEDITKPDRKGLSRWSKYKFHPDKKEFKFYERLK